MRRLTLALSSSCIPRSLGVRLQTSLLILSPSLPVSRCRCVTTAPVAPDKDSLIPFVNATSVQLNLKSWKSGGCPITGFAVKYKQRQEVMWTAIADSKEEPASHSGTSGAARDGVVLIDGLHPQTWYSIQVTAASDAGSSEAEYSILTPAFRDASKC